MDDTQPEPPSSRRERQRHGIERAMAAGDLGRATALAQEHLLEFPDDEIVRALLDQT